jgi:hypothetical protein
MLERTVGQLQPKGNSLQNAQHKAALISTGTRCVIAGNRIINGKRYAFEVEAAACVTGQDAADVDLRVASAVLDRVQELSHKSLADYARLQAEPASGNVLDDRAETEFGTLDYSGLLDCVIVDQRDTDLPKHLKHPPENLLHEVDQAAKVRGRLVFVVTGQMIEANIESPDRATAEWLCLSFGTRRPT